jgi:hypothetical protein
LKKQFSSFNRLSFDEEIEVNRELAFEGTIVPQAKVYKGCT